MIQLPFTIPSCSIFGTRTSAIVSENEDPIDALRDELIQTISTDLQVKIGDVTMFLCAWLDPEHWTQEWTEELGINHEDVSDTVRGIIEEAMEES